MLNAQVPGADERTPVGEPVPELFLSKGKVGGE